MLIGIDEAGRGPILGPMVLAAVAIDPSREAELWNLGVQDSKKFGSGWKGHNRRTQIRHSILQLCAKHAVEVVEPETVDEWVNGRGLNALEREVAGRLLEAVGATESDSIVADGVGLFGPMRASWPSLRAEDKADARHVAVAAASVLAKWERDHRMGLIVAKYEKQGFDPIRGGGYVNAGSIAFLEAYEARNGELPPEMRKSWHWKRTKPFEDKGILAFFDSDS